MSMKKKITKKFILTGGVVIVLTTLLMIIVFYSLFKREIFFDLKTNSEIVENVIMGEFDRNEASVFQSDALRITLISREGEVLFDNNAKSDAMGNHKQRPEIIDAFQFGTGTAIRHSDTLNQNTYYYAKLLSDGTVLRVAKQSRGLTSLFFSMIPVILIGILVLLVVCSIIAHLITKRIVAPIEKMSSDLDEFEQFQDAVMYDELKPFAYKIWKQHDDIRNQVVKLEKSEKIRQEFTANVSHELKTPLTAISGYAQLIESGVAKTEDLPHFGQEIQKNSTRLLHLINDIIQLSELDDDEIEVKKEEIDLYKIAKDCTNRLLVYAHALKVGLKFEGTSAMVNGNKDMIEELITNLCDNAIRYNKPFGCVTVSVTKEKYHTVLSVTDTGIGIPDEHKERIFERFYRVDKSRSKEKGGTGLGLAIVKHIVAKHDATIQLSSEPDIGTKIRVIF